jgi:hypothetical protein
VQPSGQYTKSIAGSTPSDAIAQMAKSRLTA